MEASHPAEARDKVDLMCDRRARAKGDGSDQAPVGRRELRSHAAAGRGGRPRDHEATVRVVTATQELLAERGAAVTMEAIAARAGVGKATIYRRWSSSAGLYADAVLATDPLPDPSTAAPSPQNARTLLLLLLGRLAETLTVAELTVAAGLSQTAWEPELHQAIEHVLLGPLRARVREACLLANPTDHGPALSAAVALVEGLWVRRCLGTGPMLTEAEVVALVDDVLLARAQQSAVPGS